MNLSAVFLDVARTLTMMVMLLLLALVAPLMGLLLGVAICVVLVYAVVRGGIETLTRPAERDRA